MNEKLYQDIPASAFEFVPEEGRMHDKKLETKPVGYFKDAMIRFSRNKGSVVAAFIILFLVLYSIVVPIFCENTYTRSLTDTMYLIAKDEWGSSGLYTVDLLTGELDLVCEFDYYTYND